MPLDWPGAGTWAEAREEYRREASKVQAAITLPKADELADDRQLVRALGALVEAVVVAPGRAVDRVAITWIV